VDSEGRTIWITDARRNDGKRFVVRADELLTAFLELEAAKAVVAASFIKEIVRAGSGVSGVALYEKVTMALLFLCCTRQQIVCKYALYVQ